MQKSAMRIAIYGDAGRGNREQMELGRIMAQRHALNPFHFALSTGDNQYDTTTPETMKSVFEEPFAALIEAGLPFYQTPGNHDMDENRIEAQLLYSRAIDALARGKGGWVLPAENYVIQSSQVKVIVLNVTLAQSEFVYPTRALEFAKKEWATAKGRWLIMSFHYHLWSTGLRGDHQEMKEVFLPFFAQYPVDFVFVGHEHHAETFAPWHGMHYALIGNGSDIRDQLMPSDQACLFRTNEIGFAELTLEEHTARLVFIDRRGRELWEQASPRRPALEGQVMVSSPSTPPL